MLAVAKKPRIRVSAKVIPELVEAREQTSPGEAIFLDRDLRGMTQAELAAKLGVAVTVVSDMENNRRPVSRKMAAKLGEVFGTDPAAFFKF